MPVVKIKRIISVSSEDSVHCVGNLVSPTVGLQWLCRNDNKSKKAEVVLELAKLSRIKQIEIGNSGSAFVEVLVRDSLEGIYVSLLPQSMLMSAEESKSGRNLSRTKHFSTDRLSKVATEKKWICVKLVCLQPFSITRQFGLRHIVLLSHAPDECTPTKTLLSPLSSAGLLVSPKPVTTTPHRVIGTSSMTPSGQRSTASKTTPSRRRKRITEDDGLDFEFSGLENQSRLLNNTLKNDPSTIKGNPILSRITAKRQSEVNNQDELGDELSSEKGFIRKKLLTKELPKVESVDFLESYSVKDEGVNRYSLLKLSNLDNSAEIGVDNKGSRERKRRNKTASPGQWISSRKKNRNIRVKSQAPLDIPNNFEHFPTASTEQKSLDSYFQKDVINNEVICIDDDESNDVITNAPIISEPLLITDDVPGNQPGDDCAQCPVCGVWFPLYAVEVHASQCAERTYGNISSDAIHV